MPDAPLSGYLALLLDLKLLHFQDARPRVFLVPLRTTRDFLRGGGWPMVLNLGGNLAALAPVEFLVPVYCRGRIIASCAGPSLAIELLQYLSGVRTADVDDVLLNALGNALGYLAYRVARALARTRAPAPAR